ncbi:uncharacterized protein LOC119637241 [Glossina fuscipes]|uniref:Uncharacterized protein LOC119637241 n=1 Tax=Glossina fuscipes TaxID=7396 RepID=A0A9C5Z379_9MUSC|nr:uncharacterized protein LOC119637241 [Glossina fuscipes]KAI9582173.1 hypothetical protein GQX74_015296 [Glossina fuscipes]
MRFHIIFKLMSSICFMHTIESKNVIDLLEGKIFAPSQYQQQQLKPAFNFASSPVNQKQMPISEIPKNMQQFQETLNEVKFKCANAMIPRVDSNKLLMHEDQPSLREKCLMACILKRMKLMDSDYKLSVPTISHIAGMISNENPLLISMAAATASNCNHAINAREPCEAANQINKCIADELKAHKLNLIY